MIHYTLNMTVKPHTATKLSAFTSITARSIYDSILTFSMKIVFNFNNPLTETKPNVLVICIRLTVALLYSKFVGLYLGAFMLYFL